jgi:hypothetical protein
MSSMQTVESGKNKRSLKTLIKNGRNKYFRHGDVLLVRVESESELKDANKLIATGNTVVQEGEFTGHAHRLQTAGSAQTEIFANLDNPDEKYVAVIDGQATLNHEEHKQITVEEGLYKVTIEREWDPTTKMKRQVYD